MSVALLRHLAPELLLLVGACAALFTGRLPGAGRTTAWIGAGVAAAAGVAALLVPAGGTALGGMLAFEGTALFGRAAVGALTAVWCIWLAGRGMPGEPRSVAVAQALLSAGGAMLLAAAADLVTFFLAAELSTMPAYVLMGYRRRDAAALEGALKYFLLSMLTGLVTLYGLSLLFGASGTSLYAEIDLSRAGMLGIVGAVMAVSGVFAKLSAAPFHFWAPDAYAGAPAASVAFVSTVPKVAGTVALVRLAAVLVPQSAGLGAVFAIAAAASMLLGNLAAYPQSDLRRLMAYSGIAHSGYLLLGIAAGATAAGVTVLYAVAYAVPSMAVMLLAAEEGSTLGDLSGLVTRRPWAAWALAAWLLSLVGVPPLWGFFGKLYLFSTAYGAGQVALVVLALAMSAVSAGYYFRVLRPAFLAPAAAEREPAARSWESAIALRACALATLALGAFGGPLLALLGAPAG
ncbi:MAG: NADH-quinone oxidoreductase subunit N [Actinobacteria bacterium]|nr:MAG: NADH-quinone oxidoreductase subunit N [Actinomycetota bacterium]